MSVLILGRAEVHRLLPFREGIDAMDRVLRLLATGGTVQPLRTIVATVPDRALLASMPGYLSTPETLGSKVLTVAPTNRDSGRPSHQGVVLLFDPSHGEPLALVDATALTEIRTACVSAVATRTLARAGAAELLILGSGAQAGPHARAISEVRPIRRIRLWDRRPERARELAARLSREMTSAVEAVPDTEAAVRSAEIICTVTSSRIPIVRGEWLAPGVHLNAVGAVGPGMRELDTLAVRTSRVIVDRRESVWREAEDLRAPLAEGAIGTEHVAGELGEVLRGSVPGRTSDRERTLFKSVGLAVEDLAAARHVYDRAVTLGVGSRIDLEGGPEPGNTSRP